MAKKDTSASSGQSEAPKVRKSRKAASAEVSIESVAFLPSDADVARKAYSLWESRGRPMGSPEEDWYRAQQELRADARANGAHA